MEVSRRRSLQKHLEPARPLRRIVHIDAEPKIDAATCAQALEDRWIPQTNIGVEQFFKIFSLQKPRKVGRLCYTREFLVGLATCPLARMKPEFLPEHPVVLTQAREPGDLMFPNVKWRGGEEEIPEEVSGNSFVHCQEVNRSDLDV